MANGRNVLEKMRANPWILATGFLALVLIVMILLGGNSTTGSVVSSDEAADNLLTFVEAQSSSANAAVLSAERDGAVHSVLLSYNGEEVPVYVTLDGNYLISGLVPMAIADSSSSGTNTQPDSYSAEDLVKLGEFSECLADAGVKIYGANWCGWTKRWVVDTLGGFDVAAPVYIECTESEELCASEGVRGYPTTKINGVVYTGDRTLDAISAETGCEVPELVGASADSSSSGNVDCGA